jgi:uncharacterized protein (DUF2147 family)
MRKIYLMFLMVWAGLSAVAQDAFIAEEHPEPPAETANATMPDITGKWMTVDDYDKEPSSHILLSEREGRIFGRVVKLFKQPADKRCDVCPGDLKDQLLLNMVVVEKMLLKGGYYQGGQILDPTRGRWYHCEMWLKDGDPNTLVVRGYVGFYYRTQYWRRVE